VASDIEKAETGSGEAAGPAAPGPGWRDRLQLWALAELFVLCGFAIAQPLLDVTGKSPDFFLFRRAGRLDIVALVLGVILLPALLIWGLEVTVGLVSERVRRFLHLAAVAGPVLRGQADLVVGSRTIGVRQPGAMTVFAVVANRTLGLACRLLFGVPLSDLGPFRAIRRDTLLDLGVRDRGQGWPLEMIGRAGQAGSGSAHRESSCRSNLPLPPPVVPHSTACHRGMHRHS
jgi:hypothetical protein